MAQRSAFRYLFTLSVLMLLLLAVTTVQAAAALIPAPPQIAARAYLSWMLIRAISSPPIVKMNVSPLPA